MIKKNSKKLVKELRAEIAALEKENMEKTNTITSFNVDIRRLKEQVSDLTELIEQDAARECGCFTLCNDSGYKEVVEILINNGYVVELEKISRGQEVKVAIREGELWKEGE